MLAIRLVARVNWTWVLPSCFERRDLVSGAFGWGVARLPLCANNRPRKNCWFLSGGIAMKCLWGALLASLAASTLAQANGVSAGPGRIAGRRLGLWYDKFAH